MKKYILAGLIALILIGSAVVVLSRNDANSDNVTAKPGSLTISELGFKMKLTDPLRDLVYKVGNGPEVDLAADFSSRKLAEVGGEACAAGNHVGVSPYPLGEVVVAKETPEDMAKETAENFEEGLGDFITKVGDRYLYYREPPAEPCSTNPEAQKLQKDTAKALRSALKTAQPTGTAPKETETEEND